MVLTPRKNKVGNKEQPCNFSRSIYYCCLIVLWWIHPFLLQLWFIHWRIQTSPSSFHISLSLAYWCQFLPEILSVSSFHLFRIYPMLLDILDPNSIIYGLVFSPRWPAQLLCSFIHSMTHVIPVLPLIVVFLILSLRYIPSILLPTDLCVVLSFPVLCMSYTVFASAASSHWCIVSVFNDLTRWG